MFGVFREYTPRRLCGWRPSSNSSARWRLLFFQSYTVRSFVRSLIVEATVLFLVLHLLVRDLIILALALFVSRWTAVNNKESPGISSISISYVRSTNDTVRCICCTGAEDGSVALFELKKISSR